MSYKNKNFHLDSNKIRKYLVTSLFIASTIFFSKQCDTPIIPSREPCIHPLTYELAEQRYTKNKIRKEHEKLKELIKEHHALKNMIEMYKKRH